MKIAVFIKNTTYHKTFGGLETQNKVLCEGLSKLGHTIYVFSPKNNDAPSTFEAEGVKYFFIDAVFKLAFINTSFLAKKKNSWIQKSHEEFSKLHNEDTFDLVISQSSAGLGIIKNKKLLNIKVISISHGSILGEFRTRLQSLQKVSLLNPKTQLRLTKDFLFVLLNFFTRQRQFILHSNHIIAVSNFVKKSIIEETYCPTEKITVIKNGISLNQSRNASVKSIDDISTDINLLYLGRIDRSKGIFFLVDSFLSLIERLPQDISSRVHLTFVGTGPDFKELKEYVSHRNSLKKISLTGAVLHSQVYEYYQKSHIFLLPSLRKEGLPMTLIEAMSFALPIVASSSGGIADAVENGVNGFLFEVGNKEQFIENLERLLKDSNSYKTLSQNALDCYNKSFTLEVMLNSYLEVFKKVLQQ